MTAARQRHWPLWWPYALAVLATVLTLLLRAAISTFAGDRPLMIMFVIPILLSAYAGGLGPGLLATALAALGTDYFILLPKASVFSFEKPGDSAPWMLLVVTGVLVSILNEALHRSRRRSDGTALRLQRSEASVRAGHRHTQLIIDGALDAVVTIDCRGIIAGWNPQAERIFGWARSESLGRPLADLIIPAAHREAHRKGLERYIRTGKAVVLNTRIELSALHRDGHEFPIELSIIPIGEGEDVAFCAFVRDISERVQAARALNESRLHYQTLAESLPHLVWTCRPDGWCDYLSRQWVEYTGRSAEEQLGYGWAEQLHPEDREPVQAAWKEATARGDRFDVEFRIRRADGQYRWFKTRAVPLRDPAGEIVKWFGSNTDLEDLKRSEEKLRTQLQGLSLLHTITRAIGEREDVESIYQVVTRTLEEQLPVDFCAVCHYDRPAQVLNVVRVGPRSETLARALAMSEKSVVPIDNNGLSLCVRGQLAYEPDTAATDLPFPRRLAEGGIRSLVVAPLQVESQIFGVLVAARRRPEAFTSSECEFLRQLSEHVALASHQSELYAALRQAYDDLRNTQHAVMDQERLRALGQMASGIAHDINNAIMPVSLCTDLLIQNERGGISATGQRHLEIMRHAIDDVIQTVGRLREFYRKREPQGSLSPVDVNRVVEQVVELSRARWSDMPQQRGVVVRMLTRLEDGLPIVLGEESEIREALINLVFNAADAMPGGGTLTLRTGTKESPAAARGASPGRRVQVEVTDTGVGMNEETRRRCMEPFYTTKGERGTGLGLASVYGMARRHGADIEIESEPGRGTTVRLFFPVGHASPASGSQPRPEGRTAKRLRVLVVDDDPIVSEVLRAALDSEGHSVTVALGGQAGIDAHRAAIEQGRPFTLVITDLGMPYVDGRRVASEVKALSPDTPVILLTGWGQRLMAEEDVPLHVDRVLSKPPKLHELRQSIVELAG